MDTTPEKKVTVASDWLAGCAGCHMSLLDMDERLIQLLEKVSLHATPITDFKHPPKEGVDVGILEGCVNNSSTEETAIRMRQRCRCLVALGDCAVFGGVPTMRNNAGLQESLQRAYVETESTVDGRIPEHKDLATMQEARPVSEVVKVDVNLPGCPPSADAIVQVLKDLVAGKKIELKGAHLDWH